MAKLLLLKSLVTLAFTVGSYAAIGPKADLTLTNAKISPDGYSRDAVLAGGAFPGALITGKKVRAAAIHQ